MVIDDWAMAPLSEPERRDFWKLGEGRYQVRSLIHTSQLPVTRRHEQIGDPTVAESWEAGHISFTPGRGVTGRSTPFSATIWSWQIGKHRATHPPVMLHLLNPSSTETGHWNHSRHVSCRLKFLVESCLLVAVPSEGCYPAWIVICDSLVSTRHKRTQRPD